MLSGNNPSSSIKDFVNQISGDADYMAPVELHMYPVNATKATSQWQVLLAPTVREAFETPLYLCHKSAEPENTSQCIAEVGFQPLPFRLMCGDNRLYQTRCKKACIVNRYCPGSAVAEVDSARWLLVSSSSSSLSPWVSSSRARQIALIRITTPQITKAPSNIQTNHSGVLRDRSSSSKRWLRGSTQTTQSGSLSASAQV